MVYIIHIDKNRIFWYQYSLSCWKLWINLKRFIEEGEKLSSLEDKSEDIKEKHRESISSIGIKTPEEKLAFYYVKSAKDFINIQKDYEKASENYDKAIILAPNLAYTYGEYSKFEFFKKKDRKKGIGLAKKAIETEPFNFHHWTNYGKMFRLNRQDKKAIKALKKALELNPEHLASMNQLGTAYTVSKEFEKANNQLIFAQEIAKESNSQIYMTSLLFRIKNYLEWAINHILSKNYNETETYLETGIELTKELYQLNPNNKQNFYFYRELWYTYGVLYEKKGEYERAINYFNLASGKTFDKKNEGNFKDVIARSFYQLAVIKERIGEEKTKVLEVIKKGKKRCQESSEIYEKLDEVAIRIRRIWDININKKILKIQ